MLFNLKKNVSNSFKLKPSIFGGLSFFDPLNLPSYQAGYLMNYTTDVPSGSINPNLVNAQWFDGIVLGAGSKLLQRGNGTITGLVNGFKCESLDASTSRLLNTTVDLMNGVTSFTVCLGFNRVNYGAGQKFILSIKDSLDTTLAFISLLNGKIYFDYLTPVGQSKQISTVNNTYVNGAWHVIVVSFDAASKTLYLYTESESISGQNNNLNPAVLTPNSSGDFNLGQYSPAPSAASSFYPGLIGDLIVLNNAASIGIINSLITWEKTRLGI